MNSKLINFLGIVLITTAMNCNKSKKTDNTGLGALLALLSSSSTAPAGKSCASATDVTSIKTGSDLNMAVDSSASFASADSLCVDLTANTVYTPSVLPTDFTAKSKIEIKSLYTASNFYMMFQWEDNTKSLDRYPWEKQAGGTWTQKKAPDAASTDHGAAIGARGAKENTYYEDKLGVQWAIDATKSAAFISSGCYASCHVNDTSKDYYKYHGTSQANQVTDLWHWKAVRSQPNGQVDDGHVSARGSAALDGASGSCVASPTTTTQNNCRINDTVATSTDWDYLDNIAASVFAASATVKPEFATNKGACTSATVGTPCFMGVGDGKLNVTPTTAGSGEGFGAMLTATVKTFADTFTTGDKVSSLISQKLTGGRGDVTSYAKYDATAKKWTLITKRALLTTEKSQDVQFSDLTATYYFGVAPFDNNQINHAIHGGTLKLKFK